MSQQQQYKKTNSKPFNPLFCIPSPRDITVIKEAFSYIPYTKLWIKYFFDEKLAYKVLRNYFLEHKEYSHLVIMPDDLYVDYETVDKLIADLGKKDYPVLSGICNFNCESWTMYDVDLAIDYNNSVGREYLLANGVPKFEYYVKSGKLSGIKRVAFAGFPLTFIRRDVVEQIPFESTGQGLDSHFSLQCLIKRIDQYVDFDARNIHLKGIENSENISTLMGFEFSERINTKVNFKRKDTPKLILDKVDGTKEEILDYAKYI